MDVVAGLLSSPSAQAALEAAVAEVRKSDGTLHLVQFVQDGGTSSTAQRSRDGEGQGADLQAEVEHLRSVGVSCQGHPVVGAPNPAAAILRVAREQEADLIVIGMRQRTRVGKLLLGSNAQNILLRSDCPVLAVRPDDGSR